MGKKGQATMKTNRAADVAASGMWRDALLLAGLSQKKITAPAAEETPLAWFTGQLWDHAKGAVQTDWKESVASICDSLASVLKPHGILLDVEEDDEDPLTLTIQADGAESSAALAGVRRKDVDQAACLFAVAGLLPKRVEIYSLRGLEDSDSWGYLVLEAEQWKALRKLLGKKFGLAFAQHKAAKIKVLSKAGTSPKQRAQDPKPGKKASAKKSATVLTSRASSVKFLTRETIKKNIELGAKLAPKELRNLAQRTRGRVEGAWNMPVPPGAKQAELDRHEFASGLADWIVIDGHTFLARGLLRVFRGDEKGYADVAGVARSVVSALRMKIQWDDWLCRAYGKDLRGRLLGDWSDLNQSTLHLLTAISLRQDDHVDALFRRMMVSLRADSKGWNSSPLEPFALGLYCRWRRIKPDFPLVKSPGRGVFQAVLDRWDHERKFASAVLGLCDYHATHCKDFGVDAFAYAPFQFYPVELHALARIRADEGLSMPWPAEHPLLATPLGPPPAAVTAVPDKTLEKALQRCRELDLGLPEI